MRITIALGGHPGPELLPFIVCGQQGWFAEAGLEVALAPEPADALSALADGSADVAVASPLRLLRGVPAGAQSAGCLLESDGGVVLHRDAVKALFDGDPIQVAIASGGEPAHALARILLEHWVQKRGYVLEDDQLVVEDGAPEVLDNLSQGFDAAFPCHDHSDGELGRRMGLSAVLARPEEADLPNFVGVELIAAAGADAAALQALRDALTRATEALSEDFGFAQAAWYAYSQQEKTPLTDALVIEACGRFLAPVRLNANRWRPLVELMFSKGLSAISPAEYERLYASRAAAAA